MASAMVDIDPWIKWTLAIIAGGGTAGLIKGTSSTTRAISSVTTAGLGNSVVATIEVLGSILLSVLSIFAPVAAILVVIYLAYKIFRKPGSRKSLP
jgi:hypothetical protein